jgi:hypothetical protein
MSFGTIVYNPISNGILLSTGGPVNPGLGTMFELTIPGLYWFDFEASLGATGSLALYTGASSAGVVIDNNSIAGASTSFTWVHGRSMVVVNGSPVYVMVSSASGTAVVTSAGSSSTTFMARLTIDGSV